MYQFTYMTNILSVPCVRKRKEVDFVFNTPFANDILVAVRESRQIDTDARDMESEERSLKRSRALYQAHDIVPSQFGHLQPNRCRFATRKKILANVYFVSRIHRLQFKATSFIV